MAVAGATRKLPPTYNRAWVNLLNANPAVFVNLRRCVPAFATSSMATARKTVRSAASGAGAAGKERKAGPAKVVRAEPRVVEPADDPVAPDDGPIRIGVRLRHMRLVKGLRMKDVADRSGFSESLISKIETNKATPSINTLHRIARVLGTSSAELLSEASEGGKVVYAEGDRPVLSENSIPGTMEGSDGTQAEVLIPFGASRMLEAFIIRIEPGGSSSGSRAHDGEEVGYVMRGRLQLTVAGRTYLLKAGDSFHYESSLAHAFSNPGDELVEIVWVNTPPSL